ncbi:GATOR complex protein depdc5 [Halocaridina rubra]|uniref:GATOR complex protein depdc5 n=1 Tax=Halocaridina rubra TaxID=373956 RepID=A0AAN8WQK7_HALRR
MRKLNDHVTKSSCFDFIYKTWLGVDWKSLTLPACLPITTDYFPDDSSLHNDYVVADYNLLPDDMNEHTRVSGEKKILSTYRVFLELVSQRLSQGFQLIVKPEKALSQATINMGNSPRFTGLGSLMRTRSRNDETSKEYRLSIGRIFHKIFLCGSTITVTIYRPRHPHPQLKRQYKYRFQAPYMSSYEVSWVEFRTERLETYRWSHLDNYICFHGDSTDYPLIEALKFWRFRVLIVPDCYRWATKTIMDSAAKLPSDIYNPLTIEEQQTTIEGFLKFMEITVHRLKRPVSGRKSRADCIISPACVLDVEIAFKSMGSFKTKWAQNTCMAYQFFLKTGGGGKSVVVSGVYGGGGGGRRHSLGIIPSLSTASSSSANAISVAALTGGGSTQNAAAFRERLGSNRVLERPRPRSGSKTSDRLRFESGNRDIHADTPEMKSLTEPEDDKEDSSECAKVNINSPLAEIVEHMRDPVKGVSLLNRQSDLPALTFIAADATVWVCERVDGASCEIIAVELLQRMVQQELICHASGERKHPFIHGFFLYFFLTGNKEQDQISIEACAYRNEWHEIEVEVLNAKPITVPPTPRSISPPVLCPTFLQPDLPPHIPWKGRFGLYKTGQLDMDCNNRSDRSEWGHIKYHSYFNPLQSFEIIVQWLCATGTIVTDLMVTWQRKAQTCGLHLFPVPSDPFALPYSYNSDPLRGPILIPLNIDCLGAPDGQPFAQFPSSTWGRRMHLFQEAILQKFGFVAYVTETHSVEQNQYVHVTGNMFVMIHSPSSGMHTHPFYPSEMMPRGGRTPTTPVTPSTFTQADYLYGAASPHVEYFHRLIADLYSHELSDVQPGFLWSFNHMLTKRWKSHISGDEALAEKMLHDFRQFCCNAENRLRDFWDSHLPLLFPSSQVDELIAEP